MILNHTQLHYKFHMFHKTGPRIVFTDCFGPGTYTATNLCAACCFLFGISDDEFALQGVTKMHGIMSGQPLEYLPRSLENLTFGAHFNSGLQLLSLPSRLRSLVLGDAFDQTLLGISWPDNLQNLTLGSSFKKNLKDVIFPRDLRSLTLGAFSASLSDVNFPNSLQSLALRRLRSQSLVAWVDVEDPAEFLWPWGHVY